MVKYYASALFDPTISRRRASSISNSRDNTYSRIKNNSSIVDSNTECVKISDNQLAHKKNDKNEDILEINDIMIEELNLLLLNDTFNERDLLSDIDNQIILIGKSTLICLVREYRNLLNMINEKLDRISSEGWFYENRDINLTDITFDNVLRDDFGNKFNEILGLLLTPDFLSDRISIVVYKYYTYSLEYLVYNEYDCC